VQTPPQHSDPDWHVSPFCWQNDGDEHTPFEQNCEQHCEFCVHTFPTLAPQLGLIGVQVPPDPQMPLQHCTLPLQARPSDVHAGNWHEPPVHVPLQQSLG